ncbi:Uncharacterised protein [Mycobacteroides abscessus subsp. abscessus]|uniref:Uncharacterized protein n=1 Tax=Mycobacteroides abscessus TaxID=36809 RepID=A0AB33T9J6_9MYCO|nr:hypothetical protein [Mycobacteroides abscessus]SHO86109.1 Uncharacterised protein [Mycobacteroides abscessus subsp. abscessus]CPT40574.1 Uncharacterised protein [Mycobacteroides abscessus]CPT42248.1 Uncharacterised protein [Mycobacteroides abscessus]CPT56586.1 Uncharacterised protein [Mycobacteroides abscessus]
MTLSECAEHYYVFHGICIVNVGEVDLGVGVPREVQKEPLPGQSYSPCKYRMFLDWRAETALQHRAVVHSGAIAVLDHSRAGESECGLRRR